MMVEKEVIRTLSVLLIFELIAIIALAYVEVQQARLTRRIMDYNVTILQRIEGKDYELY